MISILGIIPARKGSKRLPRKNLSDLAGKPLVSWAIEAALASKLLSKLVVSSDDEDVLAIAGRYDSSSVLERPAHLAGDESPAIDYVMHALKELEADGQEKFEVIAIIQPSSPLTLPVDIDGTIQLLLKTGADTAVSVTGLDHAVHPIKMKLLQGDRLLPYVEEEKGRMAAHQLPQVFVRNCAVYASRRAVVEGGQFIGKDCRGYQMPRERSVDINERIDLEFARFLMTKALGQRV